MKKGQKISDGTHDIHFQINNEEYFKLLKMTKNNGLTRTQVLRNLISNKEITLISSEDVRNCYTALTRIGNNINQISAKYNAMGFLDIKGLQKQLSDVSDVTHTLFMLITTGQLGKGSETVDWKQQVSKILNDSENLIDFLANFYQKSCDFYKNRPDS